MVAFAANSLLCRMALGQQLIDAASFTSIRIVTGAVTLGIITAPRWRKSGPAPNWIAVAALSCYLVAPGVTAPDPFGAALMVIAGIGWGVYSLLGRGSGIPLMATSSNFIYSVPIAIVISVLFIGSVDLTGRGVLLGIASGALASGLGYAIWYAALQGLRATQAATLQLSVPVIAAIGGAMFLMEQFSLRLGIASGFTLGGIWLVLLQRSR